MAQSDTAHPLTAFISFPSPYTQSLLISALVSTLPNLSLSLTPPPEDSPPQLQWADYDLLAFNKPHSNPNDYLTSSYVYRKSLIRKHQLHLTLTEYLAKCRHRDIKSVLEEGGMPKGWVVDVQFADELDELLLDDLYDLRQSLERNLEVEDEEKSWFILKPGFADRAQGIRMFSTEDELQTIFAAFEPPSSDEEDEDEDDDENEDEEDGSLRHSNDIDTLSSKTAGMSLPVNDVGEEEDGGTGVMTSQLRHFVIQEYMPRPILFDITESPSPTPSSTPLIGNKFHLRAYVLVTGTYTVHLAHTMLALFSGSAYAHPTSSTDDPVFDLRPHLTNTCLQTDAYGAPTPPAELVKTFWELEGLTALSHTAGEVGTITKPWLDATFDKVGQVIAESVKAGAECGSFGLQFVPNAFEIFGVDLLLSFPASPGKVEVAQVPTPIVTLLEFNASPDFHQSGDRLRSELKEMFKGVIKISVIPFFGLEVEEDKDEAGWEIGDEKYEWKLVGKGEVRGSGW
ncbi:tubulin---tyrosine ligase, partial [Tremellales sp. Uapishka_1]